MGEVEGAVGGVAELMGVECFCRIWEGEREDGRRKGGC